MAQGRMKMPEKKKTGNVEVEMPEQFQPCRRPEPGRFVLQVDRQSKSSYQTAETAKSAGLAIKKCYPLLHVAVYDTVECTTSIVTAPVRFQ
jgi:hypothetical protein